MFLYLTMEFGRIPERDIAFTDFSLPPDVEANGQILSGKPANTKIYFGLEKWGRKEWVGKLYPNETKDAQFLSQYVKSFNSIEFNSSHYRAYQPDEINKWTYKTEGKEFKYFPKVWNDISHYSGFKDTDEKTGQFLTGIRAFGDQLGAIFLQVSEKYNPSNRQKLFDYLAKLPNDLQFFLEVRHPEWYDNEEIKTNLFKTLRELRIGFVITDTLGRRKNVQMELTVPTSFIRLSCVGDHPSDIKRIDDWIIRIKNWKEKGLEECYFFLHVNNAKLAPELAKYTASQLNKVCDAGVPEIRLLNTNTLF